MGELEILAKRSCSTSRTDSPILLYLGVVSANWYRKRLSHSCELYDLHLSDMNRMLTRDEQTISVPMQGYGLAGRRATYCTSERSRLLSRLTR